MGGAKIARTAKQFEGKHFMTALVTGAAGFLGRYIVQQLLARGEQVTAFCRMGLRKFRYALRTKLRKLEDRSRRHP